MRCCSGGWLDRTNVCLLFWSEKSERAGLQTWLQTWLFCCMERLRAGKIPLSSHVWGWVKLLICAQDASLSETCGYMLGYIKMILWIIIVCGDLITAVPQGPFWKCYASVSQILHLISNCLGYFDVKQLSVIIRFRAYLEGNHMHLVWSFPSIWSTQCHICPD